MRKLLIGLASFALLLAGCQEKDGPYSEPPGGKGPSVVSSVPANGATGVKKASAAEVTITFDKNVMCPTAKRDLISIDNDAAIVGISPSGKNVVLNLADIAYGKTYKIEFPEGTVIDYDELTAKSFSITFTVEDEPVLSIAKTLVNPKASEQAKNVYAFLLEQHGKKTLSGVQSSHSHKNDFVDFIYGHTGKHPALAGYDFLFLQYSPTPDNWSWVQNYNDISAPKEQWAANGLVNYMWHWNVPNSKEDWDKGVNDYNFDGYAFYTDKTSFDIREAVKPGTWQNEFIMKDIEEVAGYLQLLEDEGIPVIWRPLHEAAGNYGVYPSGAWFWWGKHGPEPCKQLWRLLYDQLVNVYGLDNLIWVWTVDVAVGHEERNLEWYPGNDYVDVVGVDIYADDVGAKTMQYQTLYDMTEGKKLLTISECGNIPDPAKCMEAGNMWSWFMVWCTTDSDGNLALNTKDWNLNTLEHWKNVISSGYVINREDMPSLK